MLVISISSANECVAINLIATGGLKNLLARIQGRQISVFIEKYIHAEHWSMYGKQFDSAASNDYVNKKARRTRAFLGGLQTHRLVFLC